MYFNEMVIWGHLSDGVSTICPGNLQNIMTGMNNHTGGARKKWISNEVQWTSLADHHQNSVLLCYSQVHLNSSRFYANKQNGQTIYDSLATFQVDLETENGRWRHAGVLYAHTEKHSICNTLKKQAYMWICDVVNEWNDKPPHVWKIYQGDWLI